MCHSNPHNQAQPVVQSRHSPLIIMFAKGAAVTGTTAMGFVSMKRGVFPTEMKTGGPVLPLCPGADVIAEWAKTLCAAWYLYTVQVRNGCYFDSKWLPVTLRRAPGGIGDNHVGRA